MNVKHNVDTKIFYQIGEHLEETTATYVHNEVFALAHENAICIAKDVGLDGLPAFINAAKTLGVSGFNLTTPLKTAIIPYLDECDEISSVFRCVNNVNIVDGRLIGTGLDGVGMGIALEMERGERLAKSRVVILGAGAVAGLIAADLCSRGVRDFVIANRTVEKADYIAEHLGSRYKDVRIITGPLEDAFLRRHADGRDIAVQCTTLSMGLQKDAHLPCAFVSGLADDAVAADVSYPLTPFLASAKEAGCSVIDGKSMLACQMIAMMEFHFGTQLSPELLPEIEEIVDVAVAMREARRARVTRSDVLRERKS